MSSFATDFEEVENIIVSRIFSEIVNIVHIYDIF